MEYHSMLLGLQQQREVKTGPGKEQRKTVNLKIREGNSVTSLRSTEEQSGAGGTEGYAEPGWARSLTSWGSVPAR